MEQWKELQLKQLTRAKGIDSLYPILATFAKNIGFNYCGVSVTSQHQDSSFKAFHINNFPLGWNRLIDDSYCENNPIRAHCNQSMLPIVWSQEAFSKTPRLWDALLDQGLQFGWSQSFHHEESGLCCMLSVVRPHCEVSQIELYEHFGCLFYISNHLSELFARTLPPRPAKIPQVRLSRCEIEILKLCAIGKTAYEIGIITAKAERTVQYHVANVIRKLNVCNKMSAVMAASKMGVI
ncbi:helix-turn-helix transcriptional regulator [Pseudomonas sp. TWP3-2]|uniref:helix-turn-helix transcriptional regulator n=1 Tax=Pseudomonas sp. TWP3-2 TaxID=2804574 RepID=UPI003CF33DF2